MNKVKKIFVLMLIVTFVSLGLTSCKDNSEHPSQKSVSKEHPTSEHPAKEAPSEKRPAKKTGDHPK